MTEDQEKVRQLQRRLRGWKPEKKCHIHTLELNCVYDEQGRLTHLHLCRLNLIQIPLEVWQCSSLQELWLNDNRLSTLPGDVSHLSSLQKLWLNGNQLNALPGDVSHLSSSLRGLYLGSNQFSTLPGDVSRLSSLRELGLSRNRLSTLPAEVGHLSSLQRLWLGSNRLSALPAEVGHLSSLQELDLTNNPLQSPPPDIITRGLPAILSYLRTQLPTTTPAGARGQFPAQTQILSGAPTEKNTSAVSPPRSIKLFYCYAHEDEGLRDQIDKHLGALKRLGQVMGWHDREIQGGTEWEREIEENLSVANIILLLVSADFMDSDYCYGVEMRKALEMHEKGKACVLPVLLRPVDWQGAPFAKLQILPTDAQPITKWADPEEALENVARHIRVVVDTLCTHKS